MDAQTMREFEAVSAEVGEKIAGLVISRNPPPWDHTALRGAIGKMLVHVMATCLRRPDLDQDAFVAQMQLAAVSGFDSRIRSAIAADMQGARKA